jgi:Sigma-70 region 2
MPPWSSVSSGPVTKSSSRSSTSTVARGSLGSSPPAPRARTRLPLGRSPASAATSPSRRLEDLLARHEGMLRRVAFGMLGDPHRVDDVPQETFLKAFLKLPRSFESDRQEAVWLYRVVHRRPQPGRLRLVDVGGVPGTDARSRARSRQPRRRRPRRGAEPETAAPGPGQCPAASEVGVFPRVRTSLPRTCPSSSSSCARAASLSGNARWRWGRTRPSSIRRVRNSSCEPSGRT